MAAKTGTYTLISSNTLGSAASSITFSSIPSTYTDLVLVCSGKMVSGSANNNLLRFNSDSGSNYSRTYLYGDGSSAFSGRTTSTTSLQFPYFDSTNFNITIVNIMDYANTTTYKTALSRNCQPAETATAEVGLWRSTAAITSITVTRYSTVDFATGSTFKLYGIEAAK
jgi:hypothetical protein